MMFLTRSLSRNKEQLVATLLVVTHILIHTFEKTAPTVSVCVSVCVYAFDSCVHVKDSSLRCIAIIGNVF